MANDKPTKTIFTKCNQPSKRTARGKSERTKILEAFHRQKLSEKKFYNLLVKKAFDPKDKFAFNEILKRLSPIPKPVLPAVQFQFPKDAKPHEQAASVMKAVSDGVIHPDIGFMFVSSIKSMVDIEEYTDLKERIEKIEAILNNESS